MYENQRAPLWPIHDQTLVFDVVNQRQVAWLDGRVILPEGSSIELFDAESNTHGTATVRGVRLLNGTDTIAHQVCLDCEVEKLWWNAFDSRNE